jgi:hypothetical protein
MQTTPNAAWMWHPRVSSTLRRRVSSLLLRRSCWISLSAVRLSRHMVGAGGAAGGGAAGVVVMTAAMRKVVVA